MAGPLSNVGQPTPNLNFYQNNAQPSAAEQAKQRSKEDRIQPLGAEAAQTQSSNVEYSDANDAQIFSLSSSESAPESDERGSIIDIQV